MAKVLSGVEHRTKQHLYIKGGEKLQRRFALYLGLFELLLIRAGVNASPGHLQTFSPLLFFRLLLDELGFYLGRVDVGVEIGHDGKDEAHKHQQRGEEDVLGPL